MLKIRLDQSFSIILDISKESIYFVDDKAKFYWQLDSKKLREKNSEVAEKIRDALKHNFISEERERLIFLYFLFSYDYKDENNEFKIPSPKVSISKDEKEISGYKTNNIKLSLERKVFLDLWSTNSIKSKIDLIKIFQEFAVLPESALNLLQEKIGFPVNGKIECSIWGNRYIIKFQLEKYYNEEKDAHFFSVPSDYVKKDDYELDNIVIRKKE